MVISGEASGDAIAAGLVTALKQHAPEPLTFFGVGGAQVREAGVETVFDFSSNAVFGLEALKRLGEYRARLGELLKLAVARRPDAIICVDFGGFNSRFAGLVREHVATARDDWKPKIVQLVSPQVWASRPWRADKIARNVDLLLTIFPFEKAWYAQRVPHLEVEFVGHPIVDRYVGTVSKDRFTSPTIATEHPCLVVLPGSRPSELKRHLPVLNKALRIIRHQKPGTRVAMVLSAALADVAKEIGLPDGVKVRSTGLAEALATADAAIAKSGTITLECAYFGVPTVAMYKTSWATYALAKRLLNVRWIAMPNILANEEVFPEFVQGAATSESIARATLEFLNDTGRRNWVKAKLRDIALSLGDPGASQRAAEAILRLISGTGKTQRMATEQQDA
jgi:lipid-A-disaccharide synthase